MGRRMRFTGKFLGWEKDYDMSYEELIKEHALLMYGYDENSFLDGYIDQMPPAEEFIDRIYDNVVNGWECEIVTEEGICFPVVFPRDVRFLGKERIMNIIKGVMW